MSIIIALIIAGIIFISLEVFVPGGILGLLGTIAIITACVLTYNAYDIAGAIGVGLISIILAGIIIVIEFKYLPKTEYGKRLFLTSFVKGKGNEDVGSDSLIGKQARAVTRLLPTGTIEVGKDQYEAFSQDGHINKGESLIVVARDAFRIIVKKSDTK